MFYKIIESANRHRNKIVDLRKKAFIYPSIYSELDTDVVWVSSLVEFEYLGRKYKRYCVNFCWLKKLTEKEALNIATQQLKYNAEMSIENGIPVEGYDEVIV